jgi:heat shock protein HtpX
LAIARRYGRGRAKLLRDLDAELVRPTAEPQLVDALDRLAALADIPPPALAISASPVPNAFALG